MAREVCWLVYGMQPTLAARTRECPRCTAPLLVPTLHSATAKMFCLFCGEIVSFLELRLGRYA